MKPLICALSCVLGLAAGLAAADKYTAKLADGSPPPAVLADAVRKLLDDKPIQVADEKGELLAEIWRRKELPVKATEAQLKSGIGYRQVPETSIIAAVRFARQVSDYRKQKIPAGVYTLRLAFQPMDGDHMGTAPYGEFGLVSPAADDKNPATMDTKALFEQSAKATGAHVGVFLLFPGREAGDMPSVVSKPGGHYVLLFKQVVLADGKKASLGFGLTLVGQSPAA